MASILSQPQCVNLFGKMQNFGIQAPTILAIHCTLPMDFSKEELYMNTVSWHSFIKLCIIYAISIYNMVGAAVPMVIRIIHKMYLKMSAVKFLPSFSGLSELTIHHLSCIRH